MVTSSCWNKYSDCSHYWVWSVNWVLRYWYLASLSATIRLYSYCQTYCWLKAQIDPLTPRYGKVSDTLTLEMSIWARTPVSGARLVVKNQLTSPLIDPCPLIIYIYLVMKIWIVLIPISRIHSVVFNDK
jgi:hypothetical protein